MPVFSWNETIPGLNPGPCRVFADGIQLDSGVYYADTDTGEFRVFVKAADGRFIAQAGAVRPLSATGHAKNLTVEVVEE